jgi:DNA-binding transcriptional MocR family regulator
LSDEIISIIKSLENTLNERLNKQDEMLSQLIKVVADNNARLERIENAVNRIENNEPDDVMSILVQLNKKLDERDYDLQALNKRVFKTESEIERLTQQ